LKKNQAKKRAVAEEAGISQKIGSIMIAVNFWFVYITVWYKNIITKIKFFPT
jgi:hypothetical protein